MKHLKKYNESNEEFDLGYIEDCFVEFKMIQNINMKLKKMNMLSLDHILLE
jgi:hypothetical protein